uniref:DDE-1 domain-containing protein n=1 Tax=Ditylenchus dipsaci TaxID=166011 RepID=A0A915CNN4_9BILA
MIFGRLKKPFRSNPYNGHDKARITVMLTARSDGKKMKPLVLLPRVRPDKNVVKQFSQKLFLVWAGKIWMDDSLTAEFLNRVMGDRCSRRDFSFGCFQMSHQRSYKKGSA